jgi:predicted CXXCH cytochrome family protein
MKTRLTILCIAALLLTGALGCQAPARYRVLCLLFDGVPPPPGMEPCDGAPGAGAGGTVSAKAENEVAHRYTEHGPYAAKLCEGCHLRQTNKLILPVEDLCLNCHTLNTSTRNLHGPTAAGGCIVCHSPHGSGNEFLLVSKAKEFCLYCHKQEDILKKEVHKAGENGCTTCHDPHGSDDDFLLRSSVAVLHIADKPAPKPATETPGSEEVTSTQSPAIKNGQKSSRSSPGQAQPEEVKNTKSPAAKNGQKTSRSSPGQAQPDEAKSTKAPAAKNSQKTSGAPSGQARPEEVKSIRSEAPKNDHENLKTQRDKNHQLSSVK